MSAISEQEKQIEQYLKQNNTQAAVQLLFELVVKNAKEKNVSRAEALRDRIFQVDAMALTEIVKSGEIIEAAKAEAIDKQHLERWSDLYGKLNMEFGFSELSSDIETARTGGVVAVNHEPFNEYIIHVEFDKQLDPAIIDELEALIQTDRT